MALKKKLNRFVLVSDVKRFRVIRLIERQTQFFKSLGFDTGLYLSLAHSAAVSFVLRHRKHKVTLLVDAYVSEINVTLIVIQLDSSHGTTAVSS